MTDQALVINPHFWLEPTRVGGEIIRVSIKAPVKSRGLQFHYLDRKEHPELFGIVVEREKAFREMTPEMVGALPDGYRSTLSAMGLLVSAEDISKPLHFSCWLDEATFHWMPPRHRKDLTSESDPGGLIVNPSFLYQNDGLPEAIQHRVVCRNFLPGYPLSWIENQGTHLLTAYWVKPEYQALLASFHAGEKPPGIQDKKFLKILEMARILVPVDYAEACRQEWEEFIRAAYLHFQLKSFVTLRDILPPFQLAAMRRYGHEVMTEGYAQSTDTQVTLRRTRHQEQMVTFFHHQLSYLVSRIAGRPLRPSQNYFYSYREGAVLDWHIDIDHDEFGVSLLLDYEPQPADVSPWPLFLEGDEKREIQISQEIGNAVFYNGCKLPHYRHALPKGHRSDSLLFHFVPQEFAGRIS